MRRVTVLSGFLLAAAAAGVAHGQTVITKPDWVRRPTSQDLRLVWPEAAMKAGESGSALISCHVTERGLLNQCGVVEETPPGSGFGAAALALTPQFEMKPATVDGRPVAGGVVRIPIRFAWRGGGGAPGRLGAQIVRDIPWVVAPTLDEVTAAYPKRAAASGVAGHVVLNCAYSKEGALSHCRTYNEAPQGQGFGEAALRLAPMFRGPPLPADLAKDDVETEVTVSFAPENLSGGKVIGKPRWTALPSGDQLRGELQPLAAKSGVPQVRVVLRCQVQTGGAVGACRPESGSPAGAGLGEAAVRLSSAFRLSLWSAEGLPTVGGEVLIPLRYDSGPTNKPAAP